jgi:integrase
MTTIAYGPPILRPKEVKALVSAPDARTRVGRRDAAFLALLVGAGLRLTEARSLRVSSIEREDGRVRVLVRNLKRRKKANGREDESFRQITLPAWAARPVVRYLARAGLKDSDYLFPARATFKGQDVEPFLSLRAAGGIARHYLDQIGRSDLHGHSCRHTFGSMVTKTTRSIFVAQMLLGHANPAVTARVYSVFDTEQADAAADCLTDALKRKRKSAA